MIKNPNDIIPISGMIKGKFHFIGRILELLEVRALQVMFMDRIIVIWNVRDYSHITHLYILFFKSQLGVRAEGLKELFSAAKPQLDDVEVTDYAAIMKIVSSHFLANLQCLWSRHYNYFLVAVF